MLVVLSFGLGNRHAKLKGHRMVLYGDGDLEDAALKHDDYVGDSLSKHLVCTILPSAVLPNRARPPAYMGMFHPRFSLQWHESKLNFNCQLPSSVK